MSDPAQRIRELDEEITLTDSFADQFAENTKRLLAAFNVVLANHPAADPGAEEAREQADKLLQEWAEFKDRYPR